MGHIKEHRSTKLLEQALMDWLDEGLIPSVSQLEQAYKEKEAQHGELTRSSLRKVNLPQRFTHSSASNMNLIGEALDNDIDVLLRALTQITNLGIDTLNEWNSRALNLETRLNNLKGRIDSLLLMKSDAAGFVAFVDENFTSLENISSDTTAEVDTRTGEVTLKTNVSETNPSLAGTQIDLNSSSVSWAPVEAGNVRHTGRPAGSSLTNLLNSSHRRWGSEARTIPPERFTTASQAGKPIIAELKVDLAVPTEISKIVLLASDATHGSDSIIVCQYSTDGYTWENIPSPSAVQSGDGNFIWRFAKLEVQWIKFIISKAAPDLTSSIDSIYDFGFREIKIYSEVYEVTEAGVVLTTETITPVQGGEDISFGRASLEVCEEIPEGTSIKYFLRAYDGSAYTEWVQVSPLDQEEESSAAIVDFAAPTNLSSEDLTTTFDSSLDTEALNIMRTDGSSTMSYRFSGPNSTVANFYIGQNDNLLTDLVLLRNAGYADSKFPTATTDLLVGDVECGWGLRDDSIYYCEFWVKNPAGLTVDFGQNQARLNQRTVSGLVNIPSGWNSFETDRANWAAITGTAPTSSAGLEEIDSLYPYNHKYLIEGYTYPSNWTGSKIYVGADEYGQHRATRIGRHNFTRTGVDPSIYALDVITGPKTIVLLKFDSSRPNHENERVRLFYTRRFSSFQGIQMKAVLQTEDEEKSPVLSSYRIKVK